MCSDCELNPRPFGVWEDAQTTEPHQQGQGDDVLRVITGINQLNKQVISFYILLKLYEKETN